MSDEDSGRLHTPFPTLTSEYNTEQLILTCECGDHKEICHHSPIIYTDGACSNNGSSDAVAGIGIAFGTREGDPDDEGTCQFSIPVDDVLDPGGKRTSQRAELITALEGLKKICNHDKELMSNDYKKREYVVKGMTEWLPNWKENNWREPNGQQPSNLDPFRKLDAEVEERERAHGCKVNFWHIDRDYNKIADRLAEQGARAAAQAVNEGLGEVINAVSAWSL
ncbi:ribonuclease H-like domain-containing protein [Boletus edulis]|nr:ribonuclease H-like domain-containing protein [Boletus edulis]